MGYSSVFTVYDGATDQAGKDPTVNYTDTDSLAAATRHSATWPSPHSWTSA